MFCARVHMISPGRHCSPSTLGLLYTVCCGDPPLLLLLESEELSFSSAPIWLNLAEEYGSHDKYFRDQEEG